MRTLYTLAYPTLSDAEADLIARFRAEHDARHTVVAPHFTMVFGCGAIAEAQYLQHVAAVARSSAPVNFCCRYAMLGTDDHGETACVYLVPDEGYSQLSLLHDRLYAGIMSPHLRLDIPFVPHITIGTLAERQVAKQLCDALNERGLHIQGAVSELAVGELMNGKVRNLASFKLEG